MIGNFRMFAPHIRYFFYKFDCQGFLENQTIFSATRALTNIILLFSGSQKIGLRKKGTFKKLEILTFPL